MRLLSCWPSAALLAGWVVAMAPPVGSTAEPALAELRSALATGQYREAESGARRRLASIDGRAEGALLETAGVIEILVEALWRGGKATEPETLALAERAVQIRTEEQGSDPPDLARALDNLANVLRLRSEVRRAEQLFRRALEIREATLGPDHPDVATSLNSLGWMLQLAGEFDDAEACYERSIAIRETALGPDHRDLAKSLNNLGLLRRHLGDYAGARELHERALAIVERVQGPDHESVAAIQNGLAGLEKKAGRFVRARELYERALSIWRKSLGSAHPEVAAGLSNLADLHRRMGDPARARQLHAEALGIVEELHGPDHPEIAAHLNNIASLLMTGGSFAEALPLLARALAIREAEPDRDPRQVAQVLYNLGHLYTETGELEAAKEALGRALAIRRERLDPGHPEIAATLVNLAHVARKEGAGATARDLYEQALSLYESSVGPDHPEVARCSVYLSAVLLDLGRHGEALEAALRADEIGREHLRLTVRALPERDALAYGAVCPAGHDQALSIAASGGSAQATSARIWDAVIRSRAMVLDEMRARHGAARGAPERSLALARASERLANLLVRGPGGEPVASYERLRGLARDERDAAERALAAASLSFRRHHEAARVGFADVRAALPASSALVAYRLYETESTDPAKARSYLALILRSRTSEPVVVPLGPASSIDSRVRRWREEIRLAPGRIASRSAEQRYREASLELRRAIWDPLLPHLGSARQVFVVPDGTLQRVHLATLADGDGYLIETGPRLHHLSTERDLVRSEPAGRGGTGLLVLAGADFGRPDAGDASPTGCGGLSALRFASLPGTTREAGTVAEIWDASGQRSAARQLLGAEASEAAFKREAPGRAVVHLATHGFFAVDPCAVEGSRWLAEGNVRALAPDPRDETLGLSGLALSGANLRGGEDGLLTALEIASVDLAGVEWIVLSGCDTGLGEIHAGEGVLGLRRAFDIAGARTLIMSLWPVGDEWTEEWMRELYRIRTEGASTIESVHRASLEMLRRLRAGGRSTHPFYWGAFVAAGGWE